MSAAAQSPIISSHLGRTVVLSRRSLSPRVGGPKRLAAHRKLDGFPAPASSRDWLKKAEAQAASSGGLQEMANDRLGDCTCAAAGHGTQVASANTGSIVTPADSAIVGMYEKTCGYVPGDPSTDQGGIETQVLAGWEKGIPGVGKIDGWLPVSSANLDHCLKGIERFSFIYIGLSLPLTAQNQTFWTVDVTAGEAAASGSWGGHAVVIPVYSQDGVFSLDCVTWGLRQKMSRDFFLAYCDEVYVVLSPLWTRNNGVSPLGDSRDALSAGMQGLAA